MADEMDEYEIQEGLKQLDKFEKLARIKFTQNFQAYQQRQTEKAFQKAMAKAGVTPQEWQRMISEDPQGTMEAFKDHVKSYVKTVTKNRGRRAEPRMRPVNSRPPRQESRSRGYDHEALKEKASKNQITEDEQVDALTKMLGWDR
jgi:hypothetical protein